MKNRGKNRRNREKRKEKKRKAGIEKIKEGK